MPSRDPKTGKPNQRMFMVQNRTDISGQSNALADFNLDYREATLPANYQGEVIPAFAVMRIIQAALMVDADGVPTGDLVYQVTIPDDNADRTQQSGLQFINSESPIPLLSYGLATKDFPTEALVDMGTIYNRPIDLVGAPLAVAGASWALTLIGDEFGDTQGLSAPGTIWPYCAMSPSFDPDPNNPGKGIFSTYRFWIDVYGRGDQ